ncbi:Crp/Fnr family transcriptional regulator [Mucilaginibacter paludis]|uniref:Cyclic nucleotide-binding protein n=1 Tax=Mucilaginibacter paludis DSM 18603 TaxID=714943 RepID=H1YEB9_9SPHI|nr:Crp/Fnr family transcriptional regulator [Mucilaginibacter paludis]EHQ26182.1 cyclic nucleotide-binding protein [Mucilaginibacter paludis DSM 18603]
MRNHEEIIKRLFKLLCSYKIQPEALREFLQAVMTGRLYPEREILYEHNSTVTDAIFVSDGFVACYGFGENGDRQVAGIYGKDSIIASKSFTSEQPSAYEWVALPGAYLMKIGYNHMKTVYATFPDAEELARLVMADAADKDLQRVHLLKRDAESLVYEFYKKDFPEFYLPGGLMVDSDVASYLLISESTLRNTRAKLTKEDKLP